METAIVWVVGIAIIAVQLIAAHWIIAALIVGWLWISRDAKKEQRCIAEFQRLCRDDGPEGDAVLTDPEWIEYVKSNKRPAKYR